MPISGVVEAVGALPLRNGNRFMSIYREASDQRDTPDIDGLFVEDGFQRGHAPGASDSKT